MWKQHSTGSDIAAVLGVTRNAVMGQLRRMKLLGFRRKAQAEANKTRPKLRVVKVKKEVITAPVLNPEDYKCTILQVNDNKCRWPRDDGWSCGMPTEEGTPYCTPHCRVAYMPSKPRSSGGFHWRAKKSAKVA